MGNVLESADSGWRQRVRAYYELTKPRVVMTMIFTAWTGMFTARPGTFPFDAFFWGSIGIALMAGSAAAINHVMDRVADARMYRTRNRPIPSGELSPRQCLIFAAAIGVLGLLILLTRVNTLTAVLTTFSLVGYAIVYTLWLKRATPQNIVIGGLAGATPPLLGWTAVTNSISAYPLALVLIIFTWTPPHFWALAIYRREDYARADIPMLPVTHGDDFTRLQIIFYTILLFVVSLLPFLVGGNGVVYLIGAIFLGGMFLYYALMMWVTKSDEWAMRTFVFSIVYLLVLFAFLIIDRYLPWLMVRIPVV